MHSFSSLLHQIDYSRPARGAASRDRASSGSGRPAAAVPVQVGGDLGDLGGGAALLETERHQPLQSLQPEQLVLRIGRHHRTLVLLQQPSHRQLQRSVLTRGTGRRKPNTASFTAQWTDRTGN